MQNYYQGLQIAHMINQLVERSKEVAALMAEHSKQTIVDLCKKLLSYLTMIVHQTTAEEHTDTG